MPNISLRRLLIASSVACLAVTGCTDLSLPPKSSVTGANIFQDRNSYKSYLAKLYTGLSITGQVGPAGDDGSADIQGIDQGFSQYMRLYWQMQELPTDEAVIAWNDASIQDLNTQLWGSNNQFLVSMYYRVFFQASQVNEFLRNTTASVLSSRGVTGSLRTDIQQYRAEARFLRALSYYHGLDLFGSIPLVDESVGIGSPPPKQATPQQLFDFIESELLAIRDSLPAAKTGQYGRADQGAVDMLLANLYLNAQVTIGVDHYSDARVAAERVINSDAYTLAPNYFNNFKADNNTSPEMIFPVPQDGIHTTSYGGTTFLIHASVGGSMNASSYGIDGGWYGLRIRPEAVALFGSDPRGSAIYTNGQSLTINNLTDFSNGYGAPKYSNRTSGGAQGSSAGFPDTDFPMFRLGEAYLIYAEATLRGGGGNTTTALGYINALRERAYGNTSGDITLGQLTLPFLEDEWTREMYWEGFRRQVLLRYGDFSTNKVWEWKGGVQAGTTTTAIHNLYPLPANELIANPNLKQNPGY